MINTTVTVRATGQALNVGDAITDFRNETWIFEGVTRAPHESEFRDAKIQTRKPGSNSSREFYSSVFGLSVEPVL